MKVFQTIFPEGAGYQHDKLELRDELSEEQKRNEPQNADSHLAFIGAGLRNCVTYVIVPSEPVYFVDLDGVNDGHARQRQTTIVGFSEEEEVVRERLVVPMSAHPIDSVNLKDPKLGLYEQIEALTAKYDVAKGRVRIELRQGRAPRRAHRQRIRDAADAARPRRGAARAAALHAREGVAPAGAAARHPEQDAWTTPSTTWSRSSTSCSTRSA